MFRLNHGYLSATPLDVAVVGIGGTGSEMISNLLNLHLALVAFGYGGLHVVAFDPDTVSEANIVRQRYAPSDIGRQKSDVLVERMNIAYSLGWTSIPDRFTGAYTRHNWDLVVSCVDTRAARRDLHKAAFRDRLGCWKLWLDLGNTATTGQAVLGTPRGRRRKIVNSLPCATELHPELMDASLDDNNAPSCSAMDALKKQDLFVNKQVAVLGADLLWQLFRDKQLATHARYFDLRNGTLGARSAPGRPKREPRPKVVVELPARIHVAA